LAVLGAVEYGLILAHDVLPCQPGLFSLGLDVCYNRSAMWWGMQFAVCAVLVDEALRMRTAREARSVGTGRVLAIATAVAGAHGDEMWPQTPGWDEEPGSGRSLSSRRPVVDLMGEVHDG